MQERFYKITLKKIVIESKEANIKSFYFDYDKNNFKFQAGQYVKLFVDIKNKPDLFRYLTIASSPTENFLLFTMRIREKSEFKRAIDKFELGQKMEISEPKGHFILSEKLDQPIVMFAGGIGITPFRSMIKYVADKKLARKITLVYSSKTPEQIIYKNELEEFQRQNDDFKIVFTITQSRPDNDRQWETGRINEDLIKKISYFRESIFCICGAPLMVKNLTAVLKNMGISEENIKIEAFVS